MGWRWGVLRPYFPALFPPRLLQHENPWSALTMDLCDSISGTARAIAKGLVIAACRHDGRALAEIGKHERVEETRLRKSEVYPSSRASRCGLPERVQLPVDGICTGVPHRLGACCARNDHRRRGELGRPI